MYYQYFLRLLSEIPRELPMQGTPVNIIVGSHIWVEDPEVSWIDGKVTKINGQEVEVQTSDGRQVN